METIYHLVLWILVACHHTWSAQNGKKRLARATTVSLRCKEMNSKKHYSKGLHLQTSKNNPSEFLNISSPRTLSRPRALFIFEIYKWPCFLKRFTTLCMKVSLNQSTTFSKIVSHKGFIRKITTHPSLENVFEF